MKLDMINEDFDYDNLAKDKWQELLKELMDIDGFSFDLENDYDVSKDRLITVHEDEDSELKDQARCQMFEAGGDWQEPTCYFRCQAVNGRFYCSCTDRLISPHDGGGMFCLIPPKDGGNYHLVETEDGRFVPADADGTKDRDERMTYNEKDCWEWLKDMLDNMRKDAMEEMK